MMLRFDNNLLFTVLLIPWLAFAQKPSERDVQLFKAYFYDSLSYRVNLQSFVELNQKLQQQEDWAFRNAFNGVNFKRLDLGEKLSLYQFKEPNPGSGVTYLPIYRDLSVIDNLDEIFCLAHNWSERPFVCPIKSSIYKAEQSDNKWNLQQRLMPKFLEARQVAREKMKGYIKSFKQQANTFPLFYKVIDEAYGGDTDAYVDDLFDHSIFGNFDNLYYYKYYSLSSLRLRLDPLVVYSVSCAQYLQSAKKRDTRPLPAEQVTAAVNEPTDKQLFKSYFIDSIWAKVDVITMNHVYSNKEHDDKEAVSWISPNERVWGYHFPPQTWWPWPSYDAEPENYDIDSKYIYMLQDMYYRLHLGYKEADDKARMKRLIKDFRTRVTKLPTFYECIDKQFKGNSDAYVDYLFENSLFTNPKKYGRLKKWLKRRTLSHDPLVKYTLSVMQYLYCD